MALEAPPKTVAITGGASGIGYATALAFAKHGYKVAIADLIEERATDAAVTLSNTANADVFGVAADVTDAVSSQSAHDQITQRLGSISVLINNAGFMPPQKGWLEEIPANEFQALIDVHLGGAVNWCKLVMPNMRKAGFGRIINMSSVNAVQPVPHRIAYVTAKKALLGLTEALALDSARAGITVNAIAPGYILTNTLKERAQRGLLNREEIAMRTPVGRWGEPEEIARAALFLADEQSGFITGTTLRVDGGLPLRGDANENLDESPMRNQG